MKLVTHELNGVDHAGVRIGEQVVSVTDIAPGLPNNVRGLLEQGALETLASKVAGFDGDGIPVVDVKWRPVIPRPGKMFCIGRNYAAHAAEGGAETPTYPEIFVRGATSLTAHRGSIIRPACSSKLDFEGEFAFVIGKRCRHATEDSAFDYVAGYTLFNDATLRDYQRFASQWTMGKNFDSTGAFGPELTTTDELPEGLAGLTLTTVLNGEQMQEGHIDDLVFPVRKLVALISEGVTLEPGDVVVTGTPSGVGFARTPPLWMKPGDRVAVSVDGLGTLENVVEDEVEATG